MQLKDKDTVGDCEFVQFDQKDNEGKHVLSRWSENRLIGNANTNVYHSFNKRFQFRQASGRLLKVIFRDGR